VLDPKYRTFPFTVEFTYEIVYDGLFYYPAWEVYDDYNVAVEKSSLKVITPKGFKFRYKESNQTGNCIITDENEKTVYTWMTENLPAVKKEPYGEDIKEFTPVVYLAPSDFEIAGFKGNLDSWYNFGMWMNTLNKGRNALNPATTEKVRNLVSGLDNNREKINALYRYMQGKVRYVNVQVGIGGWQPIEAESVDRLSYGDCKALVNYMKSLLDITGIMSYYTLADAGEDIPPLKTDFPSNQFNHVILCVPDRSDTIWLECTSQTIPFGYIGKFTDDRYVLVTGSEGGTVVKTRKYTINDNRQVRKAVVELAANGNANATFSTDYNGIFYDDIYKVLLMDGTDRKKFVQSRISIPGFNLISFSHSEEKKMVPVIHENVNLSLPGYGTVMGNRILLNPNLMTKSLKPPARVKERKSDINIRRAYNETDTIVIKMPAGYSADQLPGKTILTTEFGNYNSEIFSDGKVIRYIRVFNLKKGRYMVEDFNQFVDFCEKISSFDDRKISIVKNQ
jgi:transglutaminase-like putative cysteine protease